MKRASKKRLRGRDEWLSPNQAARLLKEAGHETKSRMGVLGMISRGELESDVGAGRTLVLRASVERAIRAAKQQAVA